MRFLIFHHSEERQMTGTSLNNLNGIERVLRLTLGCALIGSVLLSPLSFEYLVLMPLIGIYPCLTALVGWDPVYYVFGINQPKFENFIQDHLQPDNYINLIRPGAI